MSYREHSKALIQKGFGLNPVKQKRAIYTEKKLDSFSSDDLLRIIENQETDVAIRITHPMLVVDTDTHERDSQFRELCESLGVEFDKFSVSTAKGYHYYFQLEDGAEAKHATGAGLDVLYTQPNAGTKRYAVALARDKKIQNRGEIEDVSELPIVDQTFVDAVFRSIGQPPPRKSVPSVVKARAVVSHDQLEADLMRLDADDYQTWLSAGMALHSHSEGSEQGLQLWINFSRKSDKFDEQQCRYKWTTFDPEGSLDAAWISRKAGRLKDVNYHFSGGTPVAEDQRGFAEIFLQANHEYLRHCPDTGRWYEFDKYRWKQINETRVKAIIKNESFGIFHPQTGKWPFIAGAYRFLEVDERIHFNSINLDNDPDLLNTPEGVFRLSTLDRLHHGPDLPLSKMTRFPPRAGEPKRFLKFIEEVSDGDSELAEFILVALSACLGGNQSGHWFLYLYGEKARNGKTTLTDLMQFVMGDYAVQIPTAEVLKQRNPREPKFESFMGKRMVFVPEVPEGSQIDGSKIKSMTGDASLTYRKLYQDAFTDVKRTFRVIIQGNFLPRFNGDDIGQVQRVRVVPFNVTFQGREDFQLLDDLKLESPQILQLLIQKHYEYAKSGYQLPQCEAVEIATREYVKSESHFERWIDERAELSATFFGLSKHLYSDFQDWCKTNGVEAMSKKAWGIKMAKKFTSQRKATGRGYTGIRLAL